MARRTPAEAAETRQAILLAARTLFAQDGFAATSTTMVVQRAGVTRGALYHHFADKSALFRAVFVELEGELNDFVARRALAEPDARTAFLAGCRAAMEFTQREDYRRIATVDAPAVLGREEWHAIDADIGLSSMEVGLQGLHRAGLLAEAPSRPLAIVLFGALTEAGLSAARGDGSLEELLAAFTLLVDRLGGGVAP